MASILCDLIRVEQHLTLFVLLRGDLAAGQAPAHMVAMGGTKFELENKRFDAGLVLEVKGVATDPKRMTRSAEIRARISTPVTQPPLAK